MSAVLDRLPRDHAPGVFAPAVAFPPVAIHRTDSVYVERLVRNAIIVPQPQAKRDINHAVARVCEQRFERPQVPAQQPAGDRTFVADADRVLPVQPVVPVRDVVADGDVMDPGVALRVKRIHRPLLETERSARRRRAPESDGKEQDDG